MPCPCQYPLLPIERQCVDQADGPRFLTYYIQSGCGALGAALDNSRYPDVLSYPVRYFVLENDLGLKLREAR